MAVSHASVSTVFWPTPGRFQLGTGVGYNLKLTTMVFTPVCKPACPVCLCVPSRVVTWTVVSMREVKPKKIL